MAGEAASHPLPKRTIGNSDIEILHVEGVFFDELAAGLDGVAHKDGEDFVRLHVVFDLHLEQDALLGVHGGFPEQGRCEKPY